MASPVLNDRQFGILIAYVIPGSIIVHGLSYHWPVAASWFGPDRQPTIAGFLFITLASVACGLGVSTVRWLTVDWFLHLLGIQQTRWNIAVLREHLPAIEMLVLYTYRYYQFHSNCFVAIPAWFVLRSLRGQWVSLGGMVCLFAVETILLAGARDTLKKYHDRTNEILSEPQPAQTIVLPDGTLHRTNKNV